jgi:hypothetical protein
MTTVGRLTQETQNETLSHYFFLKQNLWLSCHHRRHRNDVAFRLLVTGHLVQASGLAAPD